MWPALHSVQPLWNMVFRDPPRVSSTGKKARPIATVPTGCISIN
jgi:hypothetical protein